MSEYVQQDEADQWMCDLCHLPLVIKPIDVDYLGGSFPVNLPRCPNCGMVYVPENLALGKMVEVEKSLEDK